MTVAMHPVVLGLHPSSHGFGWILLEGSNSVFDWGTGFAEGDKNAQSLKKIKWLLARHEPDVLVLEAFDVSTRRHRRIRTLCLRLIQLAEKRDIAVHVYTRAQIAAVFGGRKTRESVAAAVADRLPELRPKLPEPRKIWVGEHPGLALFGAAACVLTFYAQPGLAPGT